MWLAAGGMVSLFMSIIFWIVDLLARFFERERPSTRNYRFYVNSTTDLVEVSNILATAELVFLSLFSIVLLRQGNGTVSTNLDPRPGCGSPLYRHCLAAEHEDATDDNHCGSREQCNAIHHHSRYPVFQRYRHPTISTFRFIDFWPCRAYTNTYGQRAHGAVNGTAANGRDTIQTMRNPFVTATTVHEIAHLYGAPDHPHNGQLCVMEGSSAVGNNYNLFCDSCIRTIMSNR